MPRTPRSQFYDGRFYARVVDPFVSGLHRIVAELVEPASARDLFKELGTIERVMGAIEIDTTLGPLEKHAAWNVAHLSRRK